MTATTPESFGVRFIVRLPPRIEAKAGLTELKPEDSERIAIALSSVLQDDDRRAGRPPRESLMSDWVEVTKEPQAGTYSITTVSRDVMGQVIPYEDPVGPVSFQRPMFAGRRLDGRKYHLALNRHGQLIGGTEWGKSSLMQCAIAYATLCAQQNRDVVVWIGGVQKLYDLVAGWAEPFLDRGLRCPIDWIANGPQDTLEMMAAAMRVGRFRQSVRMNERGGWPAILLILDEVSFLLEKHGASIRLDGAPMFADTLLTDIVRGVTSSKVYTMVATQHDVHACFGDKGNTLQAQMAYSAMFRINDDAAHGRQLGEYKLKMPRCKGEYWIRDESTGMPIRVKAPYPQTVDKDKPVLHNGLTVADISWSRRGMHTGIPHELDARSAAVAGPSYANRCTVVDDRFINYLMDAQSITVSFQNPAPAVANNAEDSRLPEQRELDDAEAELAAALRGMRKYGDEPPEGMASFLEEYEARHPETVQSGEAPDRARPAEVQSMVGRVSRKDRVKAIIWEHGPLARAEIVGKLHSVGDTAATGQIVTNILTDLIGTGEYQRDAESRYWAL